MTGFVFIMLGILLVYLAASEQWKAFYAAASQTKFTPKVSLGNFALAGIAVSIPAVVLESSGNRREAWAYVVLILLSMMVYYRREIKGLSDFMSKEYANG